MDVGIGGQGPERLDDRPGATADTPGYLGLRCALVPPTHPDLGRGVAANREVERLMHARVDLWPYRLDRTDLAGVDGRADAIAWTHQQSGVVRQSGAGVVCRCDRWLPARVVLGQCGRSEEPTSELQSLMRISYAVFCLK